MRASQPTSCHQHSAWIVAGMSGMMRFCCEPAKSSRQGSGSVPSRGAGRTPADGLWESAGILTNGDPRKNDRSYRPKMTAAPGGWTPRRRGVGRVEGSAFLGAAGVGGPRAASAWRADRPGRGTLSGARSRRRCRRCWRVLDEAVDEGGHAGRAREDSVPLLEGQIGGEDERAAFVPAGDDVVQEVGGLAAARQIADLVQDEQRRAVLRAQSPLERG